MGSPAQVQQMLRTYGRQLTSAKRLARFKRALRAAGSEDEVEISRRARRKELVEKIAREIIENLIVSNTDNPMVAEILDELENATGTRYVFEYPLDGNDVRILKETEQGPQQVEGQERLTTMQRLWDLTLGKVDRTML